MQWRSRRRCPASDRDPVVCRSVRNRVLGSTAAASAECGRPTGQLELLAEIEQLPTAQAAPVPARPADTETERALAAILATCSRWGGRALTTAVGGDSILATQVTARARDGGIP